MKCSNRMHPFTDTRYHSFISEEARKLRIRKSAFRRHYVNLLKLVATWVHNEFQGGVEIPDITEAEK